MKIYGNEMSLCILISVLFLSGCGAVSITCFDISIHTINACVDVPGFIDDQGYDCAENNYEDWDCWVDLLGEGYTEAEATEVFTACPSSCGLCTRTKIEVKLIDVSTNAPHHLSVPPLHQLQLKPSVLKHRFV